MEFNEIDYRSVILGGLLHDIGKFTMKQIEKKPKGAEHPWFSEDFFEENMAYLKDKDWIDFNLIKIVVKKHHTYEKFSDEYRADKIEDERLRKLALLVSVADNISSSERYDRRYDELLRLPEINQRNPLDSIFAEIRLFEKPPKAYYNYEISALNPASLFPQKNDSQKQQTDQKMAEETYKDFVSIVKDLRSRDFKSYYNSLLSILQNYLWAVPSDLRLKISDISLYDHLKTTSAIAAVLYHYHIENGFEEKEIRKRFEYKSILVGGDLSNIQKYIYDISSVGAGGVTRRLRARSFYLSMFVEATVHKILDRLKLPYSCCLYVSGGNFLLLVPNINSMRESLKELEKEILREIAEKYFYQFGLTINWKRYEYKEGYADDALLVDKNFAIYEFFKKSEDMVNAIEDKKYHKMNGLLHSDDGWEEAAFKASKLYEKYSSASGDCKVCHKGPALSPDDGGEKQICKTCYQDKFIIGGRLPYARYVGFSREPVDNDSIELFGATENQRGYYLTLINKEEIKNEYYLLYDLKEMTEESWKDIDTGVWVYGIANHIPLFDDQMGMKEYCDGVCKKKVCDYKSFIEKRNDKSEKIPYCFDCIAAASKAKDGKGSELLGILKADIDRLGLIFSRGFKELDQYDRDRKTISRYLTLSRMIDHFFSILYGLKTVFRRHT